MVRKALSASVLATALLFASGAHALGVFHQRLAAAEIPSGSLCTRVTNNIPSGNPYTAIRCPSDASTDSTFTLNLAMPTDETLGTFQYRPHFLAPLGSGGNVCYQICYGVVKANQSRNNVNLTACSTVVGRTIPAQYVEDDPGFSLLGVVAKDVGGTPCDSSCAGAELVIQYKRLSRNTCGTDTGTTVDFLFDSEEYQ